ncbi:DUF2752 domain-containing protein [Nocardioides sp. HDW12B]|uniref:DUF2752 domain-containing protein n=1 Tax=Nocardioides sp. HDW12B TaxID=2714939 RepID=UPI00197EF76C|nr:DUF2752 domain-containing protein [Nocardioides sp. HDW12B]
MTLLDAPDAGTERSGSRRVRLRRVRPHLVLAGVVLLLSLALHLRDPHDQGSWGFCPWLLSTGTACPGCGGLRAINDLTHGDVAAAASSNLLVVSALPIVAALWARSLVQTWRDRRRPLPAPLVAVASGIGLVAMVVFWVARNTSAGSWLAP